MGKVYTREVRFVMFAKSSHGHDRLTEVVHDWVPEEDAPEYDEVLAEIPRKWGGVRVEERFIEV